MLPISGTQCHKTGIGATKLAPFNQPGGEKIARPVKRHKIAPENKSERFWIAFMQNEVNLDMEGELQTHPLDVISVT